MLSRSIKQRAAVTHSLRLERVQPVCRLSIQRRARCRAAAVATDQAPSADTAASHANTHLFDFTCPICQQHHFAPLISMPAKSMSLNCPRCNRSFSASPDYVDLTLTSGLKRKDGGYQQKSWTGTELFRSPLISFAYERGWRQGFSWAGFPGVDTEYKMAMDYLLPGYGKVLVDMSCGSGLFSRRFASSGKFSGVIAADYSENMLRQAKAFFQEGEHMASAQAAAGAGSPSPGTPLMLLRADVGRLPFATGSVAALHAGAAIHCWPDPQAALAEISRVLAPGGVFVASTFLGSTAPLGQIFGDDNVRPLGQFDKVVTRNSFRYWEESELRDLCETVGLEDFRRQRSWRFILFAVTKPSGMLSSTTSLSSLEDE